jgi:ankyrin repeat protein
VAQGLRIRLDAIGAAIEKQLHQGARLDVRDHVLNSTPLGWACRWGRAELVKLFLDRGADRVEADAEPWATPEAWARKMGHGGVLAILRT